MKLFFFDESDKPDRKSLHQIKHGFKKQGKKNFILHTMKDTTKKICPSVQEGKINFRKSTTSCWICQ